MPDTAAAAQRSGMGMDIAETPAIIDRVVRDRAGITAAADAIRRARPRWATIVARGSSDHVGIYLQYLLETHCGLPAGLAVPSATTIYGARLRWRDGLLIAVSQSGESPDVRLLVEEARRGGGLTVAITNHPDAPVGRAAEHVLDCQAGTERAIPATKTYVACLAVSASLVAALAPGSELAVAMGGIADALVDATRQGAAWLDGPGGGLLDDLAAADRALVISRGYNLSTAYETALKLKEACGVFASGYSSADVLHGPMVVAAPGIPVLAFRPDGPIGASIDEAIVAAEARGISPWRVGGSEVEGRPRAVSVAREMPDSLTPLPYAIMGQLLCDRLAARAGVSPDAPIGLSKVTRTL